VAGVVVVQRRGASFGDASVDILFFAMTLAFFDFALFDSYWHSW
jgi:hypothetical protein